LPIHAVTVSNCCSRSGFIILGKDVGKGMNFELAYNELMKKHAKKRRGERLRRLMDGHDHAEKMFLEQV
jgi:hypothetical protein